MNNTDGYELTLAEAIIMAHKAQDIHAELRAELSKLENGGHCMVGPAGRRGFSSLAQVLQYLIETEMAIAETKRKINEYTSGSAARRIKEIMKRIEAAKGNP